jgi:hypothetical protein
VAVEAQPVKASEKLNTLPGDITDGDIVSWVDRSHDEAHEARRERSNINAAAWKVVNGQLDWSHKRDGQSKMVLPDLQRGLEQAGALLERELTTNTDWFALDGFDDVPEEVLDPVSGKKLLQFQLRNLHQPGYFISGSKTFEGVLGDALKIGMVEGEIVLKVAPVLSTRKIVRSVPVPPPEPKEGDELQSDDIPAAALPQRKLDIREVRTFRLDITCVPYEDFFPDPSGGNAWLIHEYTARVADLVGVYPKEIVDRLRGKVAARDEHLLKESRENNTKLPQIVGTVRVREFHGDLIDGDGMVQAKYTLCAVAEGELLDAKESPFWGKVFPFVRGQLRRAPLGEVHPAFVDMAIEPYLGEVEMYNLLLDSAKWSVAGVYQTRPDMVENEAEMAKGIQPGFRARLKRNAGAGKFMERCDDDHVPQHAQLMLGKLGQSREIAMAVPDLNLAAQGGEKLATEVIVTEEGKATFFETTANRLEDTVVEPTLKLGFLMQLQYLDDFSDPDIVRLLGPERAAVLREMDPTERFELLAGAVNFKATGLREMTGRIRELRKWITAVNLIMSNPALAQVYDQAFSYRRTLTFIMRSLGVDTAVLEKKPGEELELNPMLLAAQAGVGGAGGTRQSVDANALGQTLLPPNAEGERGSSQLV